MAETTIIAAELTPYRDSIDGVEVAIVEQGPEPGRLTVMFDDHTFAFYNVMDLITVERDHG